VVVVSSFLKWALARGILGYAMAFGNTSIAVGFFVAAANRLILFGARAVASFFYTSRVAFTCSAFAANGSNKH
jgi:uncharacterized membrane protein